MKLLEREGERLVFRMSGREKTLLERLLSFYPLRKDGGAHLSRLAEPRLEDATQLLAETLREQKTELSAWLSRRLCDGGAFSPAGTNWRLVLDAEDTERLLQVLNELRVSSWVKLGRPAELDAEENEKSSLSAAPLHALMMLTGQFEMVLIHALHGDPDRPPGGQP